MKLLLTSFLHDSIPEFVSGTVAYVPDAARSHGDHPHARTERRTLESFGLTLVELPLDATPLEEVDRVLGSVDAVYVAGGETFDLLHVLRSTGADEVLSRHVRAGLPYIGCSAGSIVAGPNIGPAGLMDSPAITPDLTDYRGLGFTGHVVIPHAGGTAPPFPIDAIADTVRTYGADWPLVLLRDGEALLLDGTGTRLI